MNDNNNMPSAEEGDEERQRSSGDLPGGVGVKEDDYDETPTLDIDMDTHAAEEAGEKDADDAGAEMEQLDATEKTASSRTPEATLGYDNNGETGGEEKADNVNKWVDAAQWPVFPPEDGENKDSMNDVVTLELEGKTGIEDMVHEDPNNAQLYESATFPPFWKSNGASKDGPDMVCSGLETCIALCGADADAMPELCCDRLATFPQSGSTAKRSIEKLCARGKRKRNGADKGFGLEDAVRACFLADKCVKHVLICTGFFVVHDEMGDLASGSCETDGPLGAMALVRAFASRGTRVSVFSDPHNGPVVRAAYEAQLMEFEVADSKVGAALKRLTRVLDDVSDVPDEGDGEHGITIKERAQLVAEKLGIALRDAWSNDPDAGSVDCLFAIERLGAPYRNIRGESITKYTEPLDALWPFAEGSKVDAYLEEHGLGRDDYIALRSVAGVTADALSIGIGDGGNEIGMGSLVQDESVESLRTHVACDIPIVATVSNWGGTAFELAVNHMCKEAPEGSANCLGALLLDGPLEQTLPRHERKLLEAISARPRPCAVDGIHPKQELSVDGLDFLKVHWHLYAQLARMKDACAFDLEFGKKNNESIFKL